MLGYGPEWSVSRGDVIGLLGYNFAILIFHTRCKSAQYDENSGSVNKIGIIIDYIEGGAAHLILRRAASLYVL